MADRPDDDPMSRMLGELPAELALHLRDAIRGLEAEAGNARAQSSEIQGELDSDIARLQLYAAGLKGDLAAARAEQQSDHEQLSAAREQLVELRAELADLQSRTAVDQGTRRRRRGQAAR